MNHRHVLILGGASIADQIKQVLRDHGYNNVQIIDSFPKLSPRNKGMYHLGEEPSIQQLNKLIKPLENHLDCDRANHPYGWYRKFEKVNKRK